MSFDKKRIWSSKRAAGISAVLGAFVLAAVLLTAAAGHARAAESGSIIGWGSQVVGADLSGGFVAVAASFCHSLGLEDRRLGRGMGRQ